MTSLEQLAAIIQASGYTVHDYAIHVLDVHPRHLSGLGLSGGGATPVIVKPMNHQGA